MEILSSFSKTVVATMALSACAGTQGDGTAKSLGSQSQVYVFTSDASGFDTKTIFYDNGHDVVAFDAQFTPDLARQAIAFLRQHSANPLRYLVVTHPNPDKFNGMQVFQAEGAKVIASEATAKAMSAVHAYKKNFFVNAAKMFTADTYPRLGKVDMMFTGDLDLPLTAGEKIKLSELHGSGVSTTQTVALIPAVNALIVGDMVHHRAHAWLEGGIVNGKPKPNLAAWVAGLKEIEARFGATNPTVYGGRGEVAPLSEGVSQQMTYLAAADKIVGDYVRGLEKPQIELEGPRAQEHFSNIQKLFEKAFPSYQLGYMIQYGVYGLALSY